MKRDFLWKSLNILENAFSEIFLEIFFFQPRTVCRIEIFEILSKSLSPTARPIV